MTTLSELGLLAKTHPDTFNGIAAAYEALLYGVPSIEGFAYLINNAIATNYGSNDPGLEFNRENVFINLANALVLGNEDARGAFQAIVAGASTLAEKVVAIYDDLMPPSTIAEQARAYLTRPEALSFYEGVAAERGVPGPDGAAIVALASILDILVREDLSLGDAVNDLAAAVRDGGGAVLPQDDNVFTPIGVADGYQFDTSDPEPGEHLTYWFPATAPDDDPETLPFFHETGRYADKLDFRAFTGETQLGRVAAGEIGSGDGVDTDANVVLVDIDGNVTFETLATNIGNDATDLRLREDSNSVVIIDADGEAGGAANVYYVTTDDTGDPAEIVLALVLSDVGPEQLTGINFI